MVTCAQVKSIPLPDSAVVAAFKNDSLKPGWGGVLDLLENPELPETSRRQRCTMHMDYIPASSGVVANPNRIAIWTAEHCLNWSKARAAELYLFDPLSKKYVRFSVQLDELERFKKGKDLFSRIRPDLLENYLASAARPAKGIVERGIPVCKSDTVLAQQMNPNQGVICSTVLDLARIEGTLDSTSAARSDVIEVLNRVRGAIEKNEADQVAKVNALAGALTASELAAFQNFLANWRIKVSLVTKWRGHEGFAELVELVRQCPADNSSGMCHPEMRDFFRDHLDEYHRLVEGALTYPEFLMFEVNRPVTATSQNLQWLLYNQSRARKSIGFFDQISFESNFSRDLKKLLPEFAQKTLGDSGPVYYGSMPVTEMVSNSGKTLLDHLTFNEKTLLFSYEKSLESSETFLLQPGDSGTVLMVGNMPIGVVSTVNGEPTSGGSSILALPEYSEEQATTSTTSNAGNNVKPAILGCR